VPVPVASKFVEHILIILRVNYWPKVGFPIQKRIFGDKVARTDCPRVSHMQAVGADGSTYCGSSPPTPRIAFSKWKLAVLQVNYLPKVRVFLLFPYKMGIESRKLASAHPTHAGKVFRRFMYVK